MHRTPNVIHKFQCIRCSIELTCIPFFLFISLIVAQIQWNRVWAKVIGLIPLQSCKLRARKKYVLTVALVEKVKTNTCKEENGVLTSHPFQMEFGSTLFPKSLQKKQTNKQTENTGPMFHKNWKPFPHFWGLS